MAVYRNYNNVKILVNNQLILADTLSFSNTAQLSERKLINQKGGFAYVANSGTETTVDLTYYLAGTDPLFSSIDSESPISLSVAKLTLQSGHLASYSIDVTTHGPVKVSASIQFYEDFGGDFAAETVPNETRDYLKLADAKVTFAGIDASSNITALNYNLTKSFDPLYKVGEVVPSEMRHKEKLTSISMETYNFREALAYTGKEVSVDFAIGPQTYDTKGTLQSKNVSVSFGEKIVSILEIQSSSYGGAPVLRAANTSAPSVGGNYHVYGDNLLEVTAVYFNNDVKANEFSTRSYSGNVGGDSEIIIKVPRFARPGPITVITPYGEAVVDTTANHVPAGPTAINSQTFIP